MFLRGTVYHSMVWVKKKYFTCSLILKKPDSRTIKVQTIENAGPSWYIYQKPSFSLMKISMIQHNFWQKSVQSLSIIGWFTPLHKVTFCWGKLEILQNGFRDPIQFRLKENKSHQFNGSGKNPTSWKSILERLNRCCVHVTSISNI